jgi:serine/threonine-protein kinase
MAMHWIAELKRRKVFRVASIYGVSAWIVLQIADVTLQPLGIPPWTMTAITVVAMSGLPVSIVFGWYFDFSLDGVTRTKPLANKERIALQPFDYLILSVTLIIALVFSYSAYQQIISEQLGRSDSTATPERIPVNAIVESNAFDRYLEGLELIERWDKEENLDTSIRLFREASSLDPNFALAFARLATALNIRYSLTRDESWLDEAISNVDEAVRLNPDLAPVQIALSKIHVSRGNIDLAFAAAQRALSIDANDAPARVQMARVYAQLGRPQDAETFFNSGIALDPEDPSFHISYARFLSDQGRFEEAIGQLQVTISLAPDHWAALLNLGAALSNTGRIAESVTVLKRSLDVRPSYMGYSNLGTVLTRGGRNQEAVDAYREALQIDDTDWLPWGNLAQVLSWIDDTDPEFIETFKHAIDLAETAREKSPRDSWVHSDLAVYYAKIKQPELAILRLKTAIALSPDSGEIMAAAAEAYELIGQRDKAVELGLRSFELGFSRHQLQHNPDLSSLLADPRMKAPQ